MSNACVNEMNTNLHVLSAALLADAGIGTAIQSLTPCSLGGNNRTYRMDTSAGPFALKQYFRHEGDARDRLASEFSFLAYAAKAVPGLAPIPLAMDAANGIALHEFVEGSPYKPEEITWEQVRHAAHFFRALNNPNARVEATAAALPNASEACFSLAEHLNLIASRIDRLRRIDSPGDEDRAAQALIKEIQAGWLELAEDIANASRRADLDPVKTLDVSQRCLSPSDFGFHNALAKGGGAPRFLDFEYAGWDDHAKMVGDFFAQLAVPVPSEFLDRFVQETVAPFHRPEELVFRARLLRPAYQFKWCCIALNIFLPVNLARRKFANPDLDENQLKQSQLAKATNLFQSIRSLDHVLH